jgi:hypothetical protein
MVGSELYMNHYYERAKRAAQLVGTPVYQISDADTISQVFPPVFTYFASVLKPVAKATVNGASSVPKGSSAAELKAAFEEAAGSATVPVVSVTVEQDGDDNFAITVISSATATFQAEDGLSDTITLQIV